MVQTHQRSSTSTTESQASSPGQQSAGSADFSNQVLIDLYRALTPRPAATAGDREAANEDLLQYADVGMLPETIELDIDEPLESLAELLGLPVPGEASFSAPTAPAEQVLTEQVSTPTPAQDGSTTMPSPETEDTYLNQLDNDEVGSKPPSAQCSPTSLTMGLLNIYEGDLDRFFDDAEPLLAAVGQTVDRNGQPEGAIITLMVHTDWEAAYSSAPELFEDNPDWQAFHQGDDVIKSPLAQAYVASLFEGVSSSLSIASTYTTVTDRECSGPMDFSGRWDWARDAWEQGGQVSFEGGFTGSGHVVHIRAFTESGMVIDDPNGMRLNGDHYLENGTAPSVDHKTPAAKAVFERRTETNIDLRAPYEAGLESSKWGERNTYTKGELQALDALQWVLVIKADGKPG